MRLWHYKLVKNGLLPKSQLIAQWRELNSIYEKQDNHILINYIYEYDKQDLLLYSNMVITQLRLLRTKNGKPYAINLDKYNKYFSNITNCNCDKPFGNHHNNEYLQICYWNLREKYLRGQKDFSKELWWELFNYCKECFII